MRDNKPLVIHALLGDDHVATAEDKEFTILSGPVSKRSTDFPMVLQHDTVMSPNECGGPRAGGCRRPRRGDQHRACRRTESYALPADVIVPLIDDLKSGKMPPPTINATAADQAAK